MYETALSTVGNVRERDYKLVFTRELTTVDRVRLLIRDLNAELLYTRLSYKSQRWGRENSYLLNCHYHLHGVQAVET